MKINKALFAGTYYTFFVLGIMVLMLGTIMPFLITDYHIDYGAGGIFLSMNSFGNLIASFAIGFIAARFGRKQTILVFSSFIFLSYLGVILTKNVYILSGLFFLTGIGRGSVSNVDNSIINDVATGKSVYLNLLHMSFAIGALLSPLVAALLINMGLSWKIVVYIGLFFSLTMVAMYAALPINQNATKKAVEVKDDGAGTKSPPFFKNISFLLAGGVLFFYLGTETSVNGWVVTYLIHSGRMSAELAQKTLSLFWAVMMAGRLATAALSVKIKKTTLILIQTAGAVVMFIVFISSPSEALTVASVMVFALFLSGIFPTTFSATGEIVKGSGAATGTILAFAGSGGIFLPLIVGFVAQSLNIMVGMGLVIISAVLTFACALALKIKDNA